MRFFSQKIDLGDPFFRNLRKFSLFCRKNAIVLAIFLFRVYFDQFFIKLKIKIKQFGVYSMSRVCFFTGRRTVSGRTIARHGKAKHLGGVGINITGVTKRKFKPNIQKVKAVVDGKVCRIRVSAKSIRMGLVVKPMKRNYTLAS